MLTVSSVVLQATTTSYSCKIFVTLAAGESKDPVKTEVPETKGEDSPEDFAEDSLKRAQGPII
jgi:hypothetical protein